MNTPHRTEDFYNRLRDELQKSTVWPSEYLYKFIIPAEPEKREAVEAIFNHLGAVIHTKKSSGGKYMSLSVWVRLQSPDEVIEYYQKMHAIEGLISL